KGISARFIRVTATELWKRKEDNYLFALSEIQVASGQTNVARAAKVSALDSLESGRWSAQFLVDGYSSLTALTDKTRRTEGYKSALAKKPNTAKWVQLDLGKKLPIDTIRLVPVVKFGFPVRFRIEVSNDPAFAASRTLLFETRTNFVQNGDRPVELACDSIPARYVRITATRLSGRRGEYAFALAEAEVISDGRNVARGAPVEAFDSTELPGWSAQFLTDGLDRRGFLDNSRDVLAALHQQYGWQQQLSSLKVQREEAVTALLDDETNQKFASVNQRLDELDARLASLQAQKLVYAAAHDFQGDGTFTPPDGPRPVCLLERGDVTRPGELMKPGALACVPNLPNQFDLNDASNEGERRAALARWISDPQNAITWRSIVNRVWSYHFGRGIVDTPNDFGNMGSRPTHPELLDWLTAEFLAHGQSLKWLHKQILMSATYRQACAYREDFARVDSGNQYLWRMNRDRLDAESIRDAMLSICGKLDFKMGGPGYDLFEFKDDFSPHYDYDKYNPDDPKTWRRSIYRSIVRSVPDPLMETLDCADPSQSVPVRNTTITALQALTLLNNPFTVR
ncbi:MAG TPA: DUF1553 domain-containing protein, partial [Verrucomicrobiae bacterium]|nr:DUF1553 domain-containing protein [Verrucomicrobiae bacterium]